VRSQQLHGYHQPVKSVGTWNFPFFVTVQKIGPALATGCTMVIKPSPYLPLLDLLIAEAVEESDLPPGVVNVVTGDSPELGAALVESPAVDKISFTGSVATGKRIWRRQRQLEASIPSCGKSAVLFRRRQPGYGRAYSASPAFFHAGQGCAMCTRVLIPASMHDDYVARVAGFVSSFISCPPTRTPRLQHRARRHIGRAKGAPQSKKGREDV
jgi:aldehyde dehydrogenase (NAD+)